MIVRWSDVVLRCDEVCCAAFVMNGVLLLCCGGVFQGICYSSTRPTREGMYEITISFMFCAANSALSPKATLIELVGHVSYAFSKSLKI